MFGYLGIKFFDFGVKMCVEIYVNESIICVM